MAAAAAATRRGIPTVLTVHSLWSGTTPIFRLADGLLKWTRWPLTWSAVSSVAAALPELLLGPDAPVAILPNGVDPAQWSVPPRAIDPGQIVIASVGRLARRKRPQQLLEMLREARRRIPDDVSIQVVIVGDGPLRPSLDRYLRRHDMTDWVQLIGAADPPRIRAVLSSADVYVAPAALESFGIAALEARCAGLPVIARTGTGIADFIGHDTEGLLAADDQEMIRHIVQLATDPATLRRIRQHNASVAPPFDWGQVLELSLGLYEQAMSGSLAQARVERLPARS